MVFQSRHALNNVKINHSRVSIVNKRFNTQWNAPGRMYLAWGGK